MEESAAVFFFIQFAVIWTIAELCPVDQTEVIMVMVIMKTKQLIWKMSWILWQSPLFYYCSWPLVQKRELTVDWFKSQFSLFWSQ